MNHHRPRAFAVIAVFTVLVGLFYVSPWRPTSPAKAESTFPTSRDAASWPFAWNSIWNLPRGSSAKLVPAAIAASTGMGMTVDEDVLVLEPGAPKTNIELNTAGWDGSKTRCGSIQTGTVVARDVPIPANFSTEGSYLGATPNQSAALLMGDGATIIQTQPFHRCGANGPATSQYVFGQVKSS